MTRRPPRLPLGPGGFARVTNVSRETLDRLTAYVELLTAWNRRINLVGRDTMGDVWRRHILDSAQLHPLVPREARVLVDLGSGAGLPGLILSILGVPEVHLIESDARKAVFLREAIRVTGAAATVHATRIDRIKPFVADVVTARALAPVGELLQISQPFLGPRTLCLFLKGRNVEEELTGIDKAWNMRLRRSPSLSDPSGCILRLENISRDPSAGTVRDDCD
ncbi:MAG TPA: 16S rRNA (guanine(527)-N(7))-methyltransferase RsmG [Stellaceae bacterium]